MVSRFSLSTFPTGRPARLSLPHIMVTALLLTPAMCMATELTPEQRAWYQAQLGIAATGASAAP
ncbi:MAG: hypothetical protein ABL874_06415, partial [Sphingopyxis sp.]